MRLKLYKYRSLRRDLDFVLDILLNDRLYCADYADLNDPLEGYFIEEFGPGPIRIHGLGTFGRAQMARQIADLPAERSELGRICGLSQPLDNILLWSHYGDGHTGVAIELDIPDPIGLPFHQVQYMEELPRRSMAPRAEEILSVKTMPWQYEQEYRIIQNDVYFPIAGRISAVYVGTRATELHVDLLKRCVPRAIPLIATRVCWHDATVEVAGEISR